MLATVEAVTSRAPSWPAFRCSPSGLNRLRRTRRQLSRPRPDQRRDRMSAAGLPGPPGKYAARAKGQADAAPRLSWRLQWARVISGIIRAPVRVLVLTRPRAF